MMIGFMRMDGDQMIFAKKLSIVQKDGYKKNYTQVTQMYTVGNYLVISGEVEYVTLIEITTDRYIIKDLERMEVEF